MTKSIAVALFLVLVGCGGAPPATTSPTSLTSDQWHADLRYLAREIPRRHANAFHTTSKAAFDSAVQQLDADLPNLDDHEVIVGMMRIAASIGDAHTAFQQPPGWSRYPVSLYWFDNELRVTMTTAENRRALGTKVVAIGSTDITDAMAKVDTLIAHENEYWVRCLDASYVAYAQILHALKIVPQLERADWTFQTDAGERFTLTLNAIAASEKIPWVSTLREPPLYRQRSDEPIWFTTLPDSQGIYLNLHGNPDNATYRRVAKEMFKALDESHAKRLIIDVRLNRGGDFNKARNYLVPGLQDRKHVKLYVITGRATQSASVVNAIDFRRQHATLVGEPTGGRPNGYSENQKFTLPNSKLGVSCSCRYYRFQDQDAPAVMPDQRIDPSWKSYAAGEDPVMQWILQQP